jgi:hypothetical protein
MELMSIRKWWIGLAVLVALCSPVPSIGQASLAELRGTVTDESGAVLPGVTSRPCISKPERPARQSVPKRVRT